MATAVQIRNAVDTEILARLQGKAISRYSLKDGRSVQRDPLGDLLKVRETYGAQAIEEQFGSAIAGFRLFTP